MPELPPTQEHVSLSSLIGGIAHDLAEVLPTGDVAELRRMNPQKALAPAFWKLAVYRLEPAGALPSGAASWRDEPERRWATIIACLAENRGLHSDEIPAGRGLAQADIAETRILRLLRAHRDPLLSSLRVIAHHLAAKGQRLDWADLARLVLTDGTRGEDSARRIIARDYFRSSAQQSAGAGGNTTTGTTEEVQ